MHYNMIILTINLCYVMNIEHHVPPDVMYSRYNCSNYGLNLYRDIIYDNRYYNFVRFIGIIDTECDVVLQFMMRYSIDSPNTGIQK